jgi:8-oxo-dGTP pyrophosphatase MutT (NUDIX family)/predicted GNAT family acetyltransferase
MRFHEFQTQGAGCLLVAQDTGRWCLQQRSDSVSDPGVWSTWGGGREPGESLEQTVRRELAEEAGYHGPLTLYPLSENRQYVTFVGVVPQEFEPRSCSEWKDYCWVDQGQWPQPLHHKLMPALEKLITSQVVEVVAEGSEDYNGIQLSLEVEKDDEYVDDEDTDNQTIYVKATANGRELGHVLFTIDYDSQGMILNPQDLEVDDRYRGQGIAATMYDYVKSKGYRIRRSGQQTDAGAGFWNKHKPGKNIWEQGVAEGFNGAREYHGIIMSMIEGDDGFKLTATSPGGKKLGFVEFSYDTNGTIRAEELEVYEKFRGQGIAKTMYDYVKEQGFTIARSSEQTPAGAAFWDKNKPGKNIWEQGVAEGKQPGKAVTDAILKVMPVAQEIWFHGSRATGKHRRNSDTDILVVVPDDLVGDQYLATVRTLQKLSSIFDNYDLQPTKSGTNIHRIAQEEGQLLWSNKQDMAENFADGRNPGRRGLARRVGVNCKQSVTKLRSIAKKSSGERQRMAHWCANMKSGKKK